MQTPTPPESPLPPPSPLPARLPSLWADWGTARLAAWAGACLLGNTALQGAVFALTDSFYLPVALGGLLGMVMPTWLLVRAHGSTLARDFGLDRPRADVVIWTVLATAGSLVPTGLLGELSARLRPVPPEWESLVASHLPRTPASLLVAYLAVVLAAPLAEELIFRGLLQRLFARGWGDAAGIVMGALLFAGLHWQPWYLLGLIGVGLLLGYVWAVTRSLTACSVAHGLHNAVALTMMLRQGPAATATTGVERDDLLLLAGSLALLGLACWRLARAGRARPANRSPAPSAGA